MSPSKFGYHNSAFPIISESLWSKLLFHLHTTLCSTTWPHHAGMAGDALQHTTDQVSRVKSTFHAQTEHILYWNDNCLPSDVKHLLWSKSCSEEQNAIPPGRTGGGDLLEGVEGSLPPPAACTETYFFLHSWEYPIIQLKFLFSWPRSLAPFLHERQNFLNLIDK